MYKIQRFKVRMVRDGSITVPARHVSQPVDAASIFMQSLRGLPHEEVHVIYIGRLNDVVGVECVARGGLCGCALTPRDVFRGAFLTNAAAIVVAHNHPSGDPIPSPEDITFTKDLMAIGKTLGVEVLDHLVCCPERKVWKSIAELQP